MKFLVCVLMSLSSFSILATEGNDFPQDWSDFMPTHKLFRGSAEKFGYKGGVKKVDRSFSYPLASTERVLRTPKNPCNTERFQVYTLERNNTLSCYLRFGVEHPSQSYSLDSFSIEQGSENEKIWVFSRSNKPFRLRLTYNKKEETLKIEAFIHGSGRAHATGFVKLSKWNKVPCAWQVMKCLAF